MRNEIELPGKLRSKDSKTQRKERLKTKRFETPSLCVKFIFYILSQPLLNFSFILLFAGMFMFGSELKDNEDIIIYPSYLYMDSSLKEYKVKIHVHVFEKEEDSISRKIFIESIKPLFPSSGEDIDNKFFNERVKWFLIDNQRRKKVSVNILGANYNLQKTEPNGHSTTEITIPANLIGQEELKNGIILVYSNITKHNDKKYSGNIFIIKENSTCVISDIDDTIKISDVRNKKVLLENTFFKPFQPVPGMQSAYSQIQKSGTNCFIFVSASPWQLYSILSDFFQSVNFPPAIYRMKYFRVKDSDFFNLFEKPDIYKTETIEPIIKELKTIRFILIGDSGEKDPESYGALARKYPEQVSKIYIRKAYEENLNERMLNAFKDIPEDKYHVFTDPKEIK